MKLIFWLRLLFVVFPLVSAQFSLQDVELILGSDLWTDQPELLSATVGFDGIIGIDPLDEETVVEAGGAWNNDLQTCSNGDAPPTRALTSAATPTQVQQTYDCLVPPELDDGFPICFSWPVLPSSIRREHFLYTRSDGAQFHPNCISSFPNFEFNERHCVVIFDDFINRLLPGEDGRLYMKSLEVIGDLMLVGPRGTLQSARGLSRSPPVNETSYSSGPVFLGARLIPLTDLGEGSTGLLQLLIPDNSGVDVYGNAPMGRRRRRGRGSGNGQQTTERYRLRLYYSGGMTPDGVSPLRPDQFDDYFSIILKSGDTIDAANVETSVVITTTTGRNRRRGSVSGTISVLGLADLGQGQDSYDNCYQEDFDNYIDIILEVRSNDPAAVITQVETVHAIGKGKGLFNPGGPGQTPTPGVSYSAPSPPDQMVAVRVDLDGEFQTTYCENLQGGTSSDETTCRSWLNSGNLRTVPFGSQPP